jgi:hypothetical protein
MYVYNVCKTTVNRSKNAGSGNREPRSWSVVSARLVAATERPGSNSASDRLTEVRQLVVRGGGKATEPRSGLLSLPAERYRGAAADACNGRCNVSASEPFQ